MGDESYRRVDDALIAGFLHELVLRSLFAEGGEPAISFRLIASDKWVGEH